MPAKKLFTYRYAVARAPILLGLCNWEIIFKCGRKSSKSITYDAFYNCIKTCELQK